MWMVHFGSGVFSQELVKSYYIVRTALSRWRIHLSGQSLFFSSEHIPVTLSTLPNNSVNLTFALVQWIHSELSPVTEETHKQVLDLRKRHAGFFGRCEFCVFHFTLCRFVSRSYLKHHVSSPVMTLSIISALRKISDGMWSRRFFWSCVKIWGTIFAEIFLIPKYSFTNCRALSLYIFSSSAIILTSDLRSERNKFPNLSTFPPVLCVFAYPILGSSCTYSRPSLNLLCHSNTLYFFIAHSPQATVNRANVSLAFLPIFTQNLVFICYSRFLSLIFPPTVHHRHVLLFLLLENEGLIWSVVHVNASWIMYKRVWVQKFAWINTPAIHCDYTGY